MEYAHVILASLFSILALFLITKLLGCRQMNQLSMFDYINGITIGSIAAELAASWGKEFWQWAIALVIYGLATFLLSLATDRSIQARRLITGTPIPLYENGQLLDQNFRRAKLDLNEFLMQCRLAGYFDLSQLETVLFEPNGMLSILPASPYRPATPFDLISSGGAEHPSGECHSGRQGDGGKSDGNGQRPSLAGTHTGRPRLSGSGCVPGSV